MQQFLLGQPLAIVLALDQPGQHVALGIAGLARRRADQAFADRRENPSPPCCRGQTLPALITGSSAPRMASDQSRSGLALVLRHIEQIADHLDRDRGGEVVDQVDAAFGGDARRAGRSTSAIRSGSMPAIARGDSAPMISRRTLVCAGGSLKTRLVVWCS